MPVVSESIIPNVSEMKEPAPIDRAGRAREMAEAAIRRAKEAQEASHKALERAHEAVARAKQLEKGP